MVVAQWHRMHWNDEDSGIGKLHLPEVGVFAFYCQKGIPLKPINFLDEDAIFLQCQRHRRWGKPLIFGCQVERDVDFVEVEIDSENIYTISDINLELKIEGDKRYWRSLPDGKLLIIPLVIPRVEYQRCDSLILVK